MASMQDPHPPGSPESEAYQSHLAAALRPENMHRYLGRGVEDIIGGAMQASTSISSVLAESHDERAYDQQSNGYSQTGYGMPSGDD